MYSTSSYILLLFFTLGQAHRHSTTTPPTPQYTVSCIIGHNKHCPGKWTCTPTETCRRGGPCGGVCIEPFSTPPPLIPCTVGFNEPCPAGSTCTPTTYSTPSVPWGGACIATAPAQTICTVGNDGPCSSGSICTPTMTCTPGVACGGACIGTVIIPPTISSTP